MYLFIYGYLNSFKSKNAKDFKNNKHFCQNFQPTDKHKNIRKYQVETKRC